MARVATAIRTTPTMPEPTLDVSALQGMFPQLRVSLIKDVLQQAVRENRPDDVVDMLLNLNQAKLSPAKNKQVVVPEANIFADLFPAAVPPERGAGRPQSVAQVDSWHQFKAHDGHAVGRKLLQRPVDDSRVAETRHAETEFAAVHGAAKSAKGPWPEESLSEVPLPGWQRNIVYDYQPPGREFESAESSTLVTHLKHSVRKGTVPRPKNDSVRVSVSALPRRTPGRPGGLANRGWYSAVVRSNSSRSPSPPASPPTHEAPPPAYNPHSSFDESAWDDDGNASPLEPPPAVPSIAPAATTPAPVKVSPNTPSNEDPAAALAEAATTVVDLAFAQHMYPSLTPEQVAQVLGNCGGLTDAALELMESLNSVADGSALVASWDSTSETSNDSEDDATPFGTKLALLAGEYPQVDEDAILDALRSADGSLTGAGALLHEAEVKAVQEAALLAEVSEMAELLDKSDAITKQDQELAKRLHEEELKTAGGRRQPSLLPTPVPIQQATTGTTSPTSNARFGMALLQLLTEFPGAGRDVATEILRTVGGSLPAAQRIMRCSGFTSELKKNNMEGAPRCADAAYHRNCSPAPKSYNPGGAACAVYNGTEVVRQPRYSKSPICKDQSFQERRKKSNEHYEAMNRCRAEATALHRMGYRAEAAALAAQANEHKRRGHEERHTAADRTFVEMNSKLMQRMPVDLHGLQVSEALNYVDQHLAGVKLMKRVLILEFITGRGRHSPGNVAKIKPAVKAHLEELGYKYKEHAGSFEVQVDPSPETSGTTSGSVYTLGDALPHQLRGY